MSNCEKTEICHFVHFLLLGLCHIQPSAYNNVATYPLGKYKPTFRAVCVPEEMIHMDACTGKGV